MEWDSFVSSFVFSVPRYDGFYEEKKNRDCIAFMKEGIEMNRNADNWRYLQTCLLLYSVSRVKIT